MKYEVCICRPENEFYSIMLNFAWDPLEAPQGPSGGPQTQLWKPLTDDWNNVGLFANLSRRDAVFALGKRCESACTAWVQCLGWFTCWLWSQQSLNASQHINQRRTLGSQLGSEGRECSVTHLPTSVLLCGCNILRSPVDYKVIITRIHTQALQCTLTYTCTGSNKHASTNRHTH